MTSPTPQFLFSCPLSGARRGEDIDYASLRQWTPEAGALWVHIDVSDPGSQAWLVEDSGLPEPAVATLLAEETRPRSNIIDAGLLLVLRGVNTNPGQDPEDMVSVRVWVDANRVVSSRRRRLLSVIDVHTAIKAGEGPTTPGEFLVALVERLADRITRYLEDLDLARERAVVLQEELLSKVAQEQNARMYVLSVVAAIFLPLTFVTGLLGMNVGGLPGLDSPRGFVISLAVMVVSAVGLFAFFRFKKWL